MHLNMVSFEGFAGSSTSFADMYIYNIYIYICHTKPQIGHGYLPHANAFCNNNGMLLIHFKSLLLITMISVMMGW